MSKIIRDTIIEKYSYLVKQVMKWYFKDRIDDEDLYQTGLIALWKALLKYDDNINNFEAYARKCIKNKIIDELRKEKAEKNLINDSEENIRLDAEIGLNCGEVAGLYHDVIADKKEYTNYDNMFDDLSEIEVEIVTLKMKNKTNSEIKDMMNFGRRRFDKKLKEVKDKVVDNVVLQ